ncbi:hypothetical protein NDU88_002189 [Pleurodeles waltl]|uniref:Uncharacterized protein n=1 Tax=Pleurodeles waltl TaxID=8319 RepID=A0AAV7LBR3_PLEWA|nr:hypothetical protein NDU88_002189 [Pleurodeles waltl]
MDRGAVSGRNRASRQPFLQAICSSLLRWACPGRPEWASVRAARCHRLCRPSARPQLHNESQHGRQRGSEPRHAFRGLAHLTSASHGSASQGSPRPRIFLRAVDRALFRASFHGAILTTPPTVALS